MPDLSWIGAVSSAGSAVAVIYVLRLFLSDRRQDRAAAAAKEVADAEAKALRDAEDKTERKEIREQEQQRWNLLITVVRENTASNAANAASNAALAREMSALAGELAAQRERCEQRARGSDYQMPTYQGPDGQEMGPPAPAHHHGNKKTKG